MRKCLKPASGEAVLVYEDNLAVLHNSKRLFEDEDLDLRKSTCIQKTCKQAKKKSPYFVLMSSQTSCLYKNYSN